MAISRGRGRTSAVRFAAVDLMAVHRRHGGKGYLLNAKGTGAEKGERGKGKGERRKEKGKMERMKEGTVLFEASW